jgi:hypothetical protein
MKTPDPQDVSDFLKAESPSQVRFEAPEQVREEILAKTDEPEPPVRVEIPMDPTFDPSNKTLEATMFWTAQLDSLGAVKVEDSEKSAYLKALLHDTPVELKVQVLDGRFVCLLRSRSVFDQKVIFAALTRLTKGENAEIQDLPTYITRAQMFTAAVALREINDEAFPQLDLDSTKPVEEEVTRLLAHVVAHIEPLSLVRWGVAVQCCRIFEAKLKICNDQINNEAFWKPAS